MNDSTKEKILKVSHKLFADKGYNGTSVREIAKESEVNIAAINYHFQNKENLYLQTIHQSIVDTDTEVKAIYDNHQNCTVEDFAGAVYEHFVANAEDLRTAFKLIISTDHLGDQAGAVIGSHLEKFKGPPGGEYFVKFIMEQHPNAKFDDVQWAVRTIFSLITHKSLVMCNTSICSSMREVGVTRDSIKDDLKRVVRILLKEIS